MAKNSKRLICFISQVETIGDAYMVASGMQVTLIRMLLQFLGCNSTDHELLTGIPVRNGVSHVREIARMSLRLMETVKVFADGDVGGDGGGDGGANGCGDGGGYCGGDGGGGGRW